MKFHLLISLSCFIVCQGSFLIHNREGHHGKEYVDVMCDQAITLKIGTFFELRVRSDQPPFDCLCTLNSSDAHLSPRITHYNYSTGHADATYYEEWESKANVLSFEAIYDPEGSKELFLVEENKTIEFATMHDSFRFETMVAKNVLMTCNNRVIATADPDDIDGSNFTLSDLKTQIMASLHKMPISVPTLIGTAVAGMLVVIALIFVVVFVVVYKLRRKSTYRRVSHNTAPSPRCVFVGNGTGLSQNDEDNLVEFEEPQASIEVSDSSSGGHPYAN